MPPFKSRPNILVIAGPTGTGKSVAALQVAERIGGEIVSCDAVQVYRGFDTATAKPSDAERRRVPHHLVDIVDPRRDFSLADYVRAADEAIAGIVAGGAVPVVVGGTGMYLRGLLRGVVPAPPRNERLRARLRGMAARFGPQRLHRRLERLDPGSASRIPPGDTQRVVRAMEIALSGEGTWSDRLEREGTWDRDDERYAAFKVVLDVDRELLAERLDRRVDSFFEAGLIREVRQLLAGGVPASANAFKAIGYREVVAALQAGEDPQAVREQVRRNTRRYAKRQRTWFRREPGAIRLDASTGTEAVADRIVELWRKV